MNKGGLIARISLEGDVSGRPPVFLQANVESMIANSPGSPPTGLVIVEIYRLHKQFLGLIPPGLAFLPQEIVMHAYTMMPLPSAAPPPSYTP